jgi:hypothetical protein
LSMRRESLAAGGSGAGAPACARASAAAVAPQNTNARPKTTEARMRAVRCSCGARAVRACRGLCVLDPSHTACVRARVVRWYRINTCAREAKDHRGAHACGAVHRSFECFSRRLRFKFSAGRMRGGTRRAVVQYKHTRTGGQTARCASGRPGKAKSTAASCACSCLRPTSRTRGRRCSCAKTCTTFAPSAAVLTFVQHALHAIGLL